MENMSKLGTNGVYDYVSLRIFFGTRVFMNIFVES